MKTPSLRDKTLVINSHAVVYWFIKIRLLKWNFWCQGIFYMSFDFKNGCKNQFKDNNEKSCSWSRKKVSHKIDFSADSVGVRWSKILRIKFPKLEEIWIPEFDIPIFPKIPWSRNKNPELLRYLNPWDSTKKIIL